MSHAASSLSASQDSIAAHVWVPVAESEALARALKVAIEHAVQRTGTTQAVKPGHRVKFQWPPHPVSYLYHVLPTDWTGHAELSLHGETLPVSVAHTQHGVFGRCDEIWLEAKGDSESAMLQHMADLAEPYFQRKLEISDALGRTGRFKGAFKDLPPLEVLKLLYTRDRDIANEARLQIEQRAGNGLYTRALIAIIEDETHPYRRSAQWCALDLFEDLPSYCRDLDEQRLAVEAMRGLIWNATDDYARTTFKAGVVLGGHLDEWGGPVLVDCLDAPSKYGRRSAIHGLFHVVEWAPELGTSIAAHLKAHVAREPEPSLVEFANQIAGDILAKRNDHKPEPVFPEEL
jgi:hypothetical protein